MKILMLVNWKIERCSQKPFDIQPPDYFVEGEAYWFYRYFKENVLVDVLDISSCKQLENFEKNVLRFYILQALKAIPRMKQYDLVVSHGMQSGVVVSLWRRLFPGKAKHIVFDIGSFNSASERGIALKMMQFASHSIDGMIYHTSNQEKYYEKFFPWMIKKSRFIPFGADASFFKASDINENSKTYCENEKEYILCVGYNKRDWDTLCKAYVLLANRLGTVPILKLVGKEKYSLPEGITLPKTAKIESISYIRIKDLIHQIEKSMFCVLPLEDYNYSFGQMTLLQQLALGKAVITARVPSTMDYVRDGENALFYEARDENDLCRKMELLIGDYTLCCKLGAQGKKYVRQEYNEETMSHQVEQFYREVLEG